MQLDIHTRVKIVNTYHIFATLATSTDYDWPFLEGVDLHPDDLCLWGHENFWKQKNVLYEPIVFNSDLHGAEGEIVGSWGEPRGAALHRRLRYIVKLFYKNNTTYFLIPIRRSGIEPLGENNKVEDCVDIGANEALAPTVEVDGESPYLEMDTSWVLKGDFHSWQERVRVNNEYLANYYYSLLKDE